MRIQPVNHVCVILVARLVDPVMRKSKSFAAPILQAKYKVDETHH